MGEVKSAAIMESLKLLCFLLPTCMALLSPPGGGRPGYLKPPESPDDVAFLEVGTASTAQVFNQKLDHFAPDDKRTFKQRYYVDSTFYTPGGPILLYISGEAPCYSAPSGGAFMGTVAREMRGMLVALEHRYYGDSQPFDTLSTENLQYLNTAQALIDIAAFRVAFQQQLGNTTAGVENKWIMFGGSYAGDLSAWFRSKFPTMAAAALASSAPVQAITDFTAFDQQIAKALPASCIEDTKKVQQYIEEELNAGPERSKTLKEMFDASEILDDDFLYLAADSVAIAVQYGYKQKLCNPLAQAGGDRSKMIRNFAEYSKRVFYPTLETGKADVYSTEYLQDPTVTTEKNSRQWLFQQCTELGWFQDAPADGGLRSKRVNLEFFKGLCTKVFGKDVWPDTDNVQKNYRGMDIDGTKIFFTFGKDDPWQCAGVTATSKPGQKSRVIDCENCSHCIDLGHAKYDDAPALTSARKEILATLKEWIAD